MALTANQRQTLLANMMADLSAKHEVCNVSKPDLIATVNAVDDWIDANAASFNAAIPLPARTALTASQKAQLLYLVALRRYGG